MKAVLFFSILILPYLVLGQVNVIKYDDEKYSIKNHPKIITINIQRDFGAVPNDTINDNLAFEAASTFINARGGKVKLFVPKGVYLIGRQDSSQSNERYYLWGYNPFMIRNCTDIEISGEKGSILKYDLGLRHGSFDPRTGLSKNYSWDCRPGIPAVPSERAQLGHCFYLNTNQNVKISDLVLDGNFYPETLNNMNTYKVNGTNTKIPHFMTNKINIGGSYGGCGWQLEHAGILILNSGNVTIRNVIIKRFGSDGILVTNNQTIPKFRNILIDNCRLDYNGRTGLVLAGGDQIVIRNTKITNTAQDFFSATANGVDIEGEGSALSPKTKITNVLFDRCEISNNANGEILTRYGIGSDNITFKNCKIFAGHRFAYSMALEMGKQSTNYKFINTVIKGKIVYDEVGAVKNKSLKPNFTKSKILAK